MKKLLREALLGLPLFVFCAKLENEKPVKPFVMPLLREELEKTKVKGEEKIRTKAYLRLEWETLYD